MQFEKPVVKRGRVWVNGEVVNSRGQMCLEGELLESSLTHVIILMFPSGVHPMSGERMMSQGLFFEIDQNGEQSIRNIIRWD